MKISRQVIPAAHVASLAWRGESLVDWVGGGKVFHLNGKSEDPHVGWAYPFNAVQATPDGRFAVIYQRQGTKALLLREGKLLRELNRSFYHAHVYEYPVCIWRAQDGRTLIAHCPERYCRIDIDDAETGERLTNGERKPSDFFHSRLKVNTAGTRLLSAGWVWHPRNAVVYYEVAEALRDPTHLDGVKDCAPGSFHVALAEHESACWETTERVLLGGGSEEDTNADEEAAEIGGPRLHPRGMAVYDVAERVYVKSVVLGEVAGTMMPVGERHAVCFYGHPKLVSLDSGEVVDCWEDLDTGKQVSSIFGELKLPPLAIDVEHRRFAVYGAGGITVVQIDLIE
jgi:hypothetical protein